MSPLELVVFALLCYGFGLVSGVGCRAHRPTTEYRGRDRSRRSCSSVWFIGLVIVIVVLDVIVEGYDVSPRVLVPLLLTAADLLSVDLPKVHR